MVVVPLFNLIFFRLWRNITQTRNTHNDYNTLSYLVFRKLVSLNYCYTISKYSENILWKYQSISEKGYLSSF